MDELDVHESNLPTVSIEVTTEMHTFCSTE
jgi:hypothetical protein